MDSLIACIAVGPIMGRRLLVLSSFALLSGKAARAELEPRSRWGVWILPWALSVDNLTYGAAGGIPRHYPVWASAGEQALSSAVQAGLGLTVGIAVVSAFPAVRRRMATSSAFAGVLILVAAGALFVVGQAIGS